MNFVSCLYHFARIAALAPNARHQRALLGFCEHHFYAGVDNSKKYSFCFFYFFVLTIHIQNRIYEMIVVHLNDGCNAPVF